MADKLGLGQSEAATETELSARIRACEAELHELYRQRAGRLIDGLEGVGWCVMCGQVTVNCFDGYDTCQRCLNA